MPTGKTVQFARRLAAAATLLALDFKVDATLRCIRTCEASGVIDSLALRAYRADLADMEQRRMDLALAAATEPRRINRVPRRGAVDMGPVFGLAVIATPWLVLGTALAFAWA